MTDPFLGSPCSMCTGAVLLYKIPRIVIGENVNFSGEETLLRSRGVEVVVLEDERCKELMGRYVREKPEVSTPSSAHLLAVCSRIRRNGTRT